MTIESIIVGLTSERALNPVRVALDLAKRFGAAVTGFGARFVPSIVLAETSGAMYLAAQEDNERELRAMKQAFDAVVPSDRYGGWRGVIDFPERGLAAEARCADLVVVEASKDPVGHIEIGSLILSAGRPVLVVAQGTERVAAEAVVVAWKDTREARRAVFDALPFLQRAAKVVVAVVDETGAGPDAASSRDIQDYLKRHGIDTSLIETQGRGGEDVAGKLEDVARTMDADLIVAGAYGHSRLREWAFGGVTRSLLREPKISLLTSN
jgi:nucleotide-binding universal stress UspA family protein